MTENTAFIPAKTKRLTPRAMPDLTRAGNSWMKVTEGAFWAMASRPRVTSELLWPRPFLWGEEELAM